MKLFFIITVLGWAAICLAFQPQYRFYTGYDCTGEALVLQSKHPNVVPPNHNSISFNGVWGEYSAINYMKSLGTSILGGCWKNTTLPNIQSMRYLGPPDTTTHSISLYQGTNHEGQEITITGLAAANIPFLPQSIFCTGFTSWTFYTGNNFNGVATCFAPLYPPVDPLFGWYTRLPSINSTLSNVRSILKGCNRPIDQYYFA